MKGDTMENGDRYFRCSKCGEAMHVAATAPPDFEPRHLEAIHGHDSGMEPITLEEFRVLSPDFPDGDDPIDEDTGGD